MYRHYSLVLVTSAVLMVSCRDSAIDSSSNIEFPQPIITKTLEKLRQEYVEKPDEKKMLEGALNGMLMALDPYSCFFNTESYRIYSQSNKGEFGGLGIEVLLIDGTVKVISPMDDMPAQKAGIKAGDIITHVDNLSIAGLAPEDVLRRLHGKPGTSVSLKISRGAGAPLTLKITRELITVNPVKYRTEGTVGYIRISYFNDLTTEKLTTAVEAIQKKLGKSLEGIILDLRNNPGGTLEQAVSVSSLFLDSGIIVHVKSRNPAHNKTFYAKGESLLKNIPIAILVNQGSASSSEIVAAALRDNHRATLIGEKTFGKGSVQGVYPIENYGGIKFTIARFYTPRDEEIQGRGIQPDIPLTLPPLEPTEKPAKNPSSNDKQVQRAIDFLRKTPITAK